MVMTGIGDLARHLVFSRQQSTLNVNLDRLSLELASGQKADVSDPVTGDYFLLGDISRSEKLLEGYSRSATEARVFADAKQNALEQIQTTTKNLSSDLLLAQNATNQSLTALSHKARDAFETLVSSLNATIAGRSLFAGTDTGGPALAPAKELLDTLAGELNGAVTPQAVRDAVEDWFSGPEFASQGYLGDSNEISFGLGEGERASSDLNANREELVALLSEAALAALASDAADLDSTQMRHLLLSTGEALLVAQGAVTGLRAELGGVQERIEIAETRNFAKKAALQITRSEIVSADPFETATQLENTRLQLESLYTVTARLSGLTLTSFLR